MTMTRLLTAAAAAALLAGPAFAQSATTAPTPEVDAARQTPSQSSVGATMNSQGSMQSQGSMNAGGTQGSMSSGNMNAGGTMGTTASGNMNAGGTMGSTMAGGTMSSMNGNVRVTSNAPIPDTAENRARYGQPESGGGRSRIGEGPTAELRGTTTSRTRRR